MKNFSMFKALLNNPSRCVILTHINPDADALGSSLGWLAFLEQKGHRVEIITPSGYPRFLSWMPSNDRVFAVVDEESKEVALNKIRHAELIFCVDFSSLQRIGILQDEVEKSDAKKILIDHHLEPEQFAHFEYWDSQAASTAGLIFGLIDKLGYKSSITSPMANCLYAGLMTDTGGFRHPNTRDIEFLIAAELVSLGANPAQVFKLVYHSNTLESIRFLGYVLSEKLTLFKEYRTACMTLSLSDRTRFSVQAGDMEGLVNYGLSIEGVRLAVLIYERKKDIKLSFRSIGDFPANEIAKKYFNGGGHRNAAGGLSNDTLDATLEKFISILPTYNEQLQKPFELSF